MGCPPARLSAICDICGRRLALVHPSNILWTHYSNGRRQTLFICPGAGTQNYTMVKKWVRKKLRKKGKNFNRTYRLSEFRLLTYDHPANTHFIRQGKTWQERWELLTGVQPQIGRFDE